MFKPAFRTTINNVPVVNKDQLDSFGEQFVADFCSEAMRVPSEIDIDRFFVRYLGMEQDFQHLSHCGCYLGMTVFNDTDEVPIYNPDMNRAEFISAKAGTLIIDNHLLEPNKEHRYRFTVGHEGSHHILHTAYFGYEPDQLSFFNSRAPMVQCRIDNKNFKQKPFELWTEEEWMEWQANYLSAAILMPKSMVKKAIENSNRQTIASKVDLVSETFNVSNSSALIRLKGLALIERNPPASKLLEFSTIREARVINNLFF
ncbi:ImmA/IrrE family metallo-endopeptidase [Eubacteriaceae bacterium ES3]|nr:ImmA/IrrE family metallo-endopeptidase [Eubacteriaceae bacterium ES3]